MKKVGIIVISVLAAVLLAVAGTLFWYYRPVTTKEALVSRYAFAVRVGLKNRPAPDASMDQVREYAAKFWDDDIKGANLLLKDIYEHAPKKDSLTIAFRKERKDPAVDISPLSWKTKFFLERDFIPQTYNSPTTRHKKKVWLTNKQKAALHDEMRQMRRRDELEIWSLETQAYYRTMRKGDYFMSTLKEDNLSAMKHAQQEYYKRMSAEKDSLASHYRNKKAALRTIPLPVLSKNFKAHLYNPVRGILMPVQITRPDSTVQVIWAARAIPRYSAKKPQTAQGGLFLDEDRAMAFLRNAVEKDFDYRIQEMISSIFNRKKKR